MSRILIFLLSTHDVYKENKLENYHHVNKHVWN